MMAIKKKSARTTKQAKTTQSHPADSVLQLETQIKALQGALTSAHEKAIVEANKQLDRYKLQLSKAHQKLLAQKEKRANLAQKAKNKKTSSALQQLKKADEALKILQAETNHLKDAMVQTRHSLVTQQKALNKIQAIQKLVLTFEKKSAKADRKTEKSALKKNKTKSKTKADKTALTTEYASLRSTAEKSNSNKSKKKSTEISVNTIKNNKTSDKTKIQNKKEISMSTPKKLIVPIETNAPKKKTATTRQAIRATTKATQKKSEKPVTPPKKTAVKDKEQTSTTDNQLQQSLQLTPPSAEAVVITAPTLQENQTKPSEAQAPEINPADTQLSEPGRSIFDPAKDMK